MQYVSNNKVLVYGAEVMANNNNNNNFYLNTISI